MALLLGGGGGGGGGGGRGALTPDRIPHNSIYNLVHFRVQHT